ncbi:unnamed protein product [Cylicostephanus goldi]|uniref:Uncharacterized protein n=1 Tax=Cylicostephanus goldi TaxID=71465 RepID=A0A3P7MGA3_CYLGO|nr:unnamed protein product [Cylicostephanus goldi]
MDISYTSADHTDIGVLKGAHLDLEYGTSSKKNDFELTLDADSGRKLDVGAFVYVEGTEYGGIIDAKRSNTREKIIVYSGRSWHGMLHDKVLCPDTGRTHLELEGTTKSMLDQLVGRMSLRDLFYVSDQADTSMRKYAFPRYCDGYTGVCKLLEKAGLTLSLAFHASHSKVAISTAPVTSWGDKPHEDWLDLKISCVYRPYNHLVCLGKGTGVNRAILHYFADKYGNISEKQTLFGLDERTITYDYSNAEVEELKKEGPKKLAEYQRENSLEVALEKSDTNFAIGDVITGTSKDIDIVTGHQGKAHVTAAQDARRIAGIVGKGLYVLDVGDKFSVTVDNATQITVGTGDAIIKGRHVTIEKPVTLPIKPGKQGLKRYCCISLRVELAGSGSVDKAKIIVIDGQESSGTPEYPWYSDGKLLSDGTVADLPLCYLLIDGITVGKPALARTYELLTSISGIKDEIVSEIKEKTDKIWNRLSVYDARGTVIESQTIPSDIEVNVIYRQHFDSPSSTPRVARYGTFVATIEAKHIIRQKNILTQYEDTQIENFLKLRFKLRDLSRPSDLNRDKSLVPFFGENYKNTSVNSYYVDADTVLRNEFDSIYLIIALSRSMKNTSYSLGENLGSLTITSPSMKKERMP